MRSNRFAAWGVSRQQFFAGPDDLNFLGCWSDRSGIEAKHRERAKEPEYTKSNAAAGLFVAEAQTVIRTIAAQGSWMLPRGP